VTSSVTSYEAPSVDVFVMMPGAWTLKSVTSRIGLVL
jgi:hypothetical protein